MWCEGGEDGDRETGRMAGLLEVEPEPGWRLVLDGYEAQRVVRTVDVVLACWTELELELEGARTSDLSAAGRGGGVGVAEDADEDEEDEDEGCGG